MKSWALFVYALLLAGGAFAAEIIKTNNTTREVEYLDQEFFNTKIGAEERVIITAYAFNKKEKCFIKLPNDVQYSIDENSNIPGIKIVEDPNVACGIIVNVQSEDMIGEWELIAWELRYSDPIEKRLPFTIYVEENINAAPKQVTITEGSDLYLHLENPTNLHETCKLIGPDKKERTNVESDSNYVDSCGFVIKGIKVSDNGKWEIRYGNGVIFRAFTKVTVNEIWKGQQMDFIWTKDRSVNITIGPEDAVYCKIEDPHGYVVFDGFGACNIALGRVRREHNGLWKMTVGLSGKVLTEEYDFTVTVTEAAQKPTVITHVEKQQPEVLLTCSVPTEYEVHACKFRDPSGRVLLANEGVGESRYSFHGAGVSLNSQVQTHECGLRITNPQTSDLGLWRCAVETEAKEYYGFLTVLCPWAMQDSEVAASVVSEPVLTTHLDKITAVEGDTVTMSCSVQSAIRYCYFRASNGSIYNISPGTTSETMEYVGAGLDAGECGVKFKNLLASDSGRWSCHVGFSDFNEPEQRAEFDVTVNEPISARQYTEQSTLVVEGQVYNSRQLEYCRFVRIDGQGIISTNLPDRYTSHDSLATGHCAIRIQDATILDRHPWTVVARILGQDVEISQSTSLTVTMPPALEPENAKKLIHWFPMTLLGIMLFSLIVLLVPKKNRSKTIDRMCIMRDSIRNSFQKKPLHDPVQNIGVMAA
ncbi:uncharacterized protein LOC113520310 [Galleria mellonella]|uniref:Uncharacterized protein LOC113520310 n=1 Tax=Galleria mellonella TaxID=7137 RepID=A0A6J1X5D7_GALME|nr:uncharacterized protein LOC113520310 [Galleria mellonella]